MAMLALSMKTRTAVCQCDMCGDKANNIPLKEALGEVWYCWKCSKYLASIPTRDKERFRNTQKDRKDLWNKLRKFQMDGTGIDSLDRELKEEFGNWKVRSAAIWGT